MIKMEKYSSSQPKNELKSYVSKKRSGTENKRRKIHCRGIKKLLCDATGNGKV